MSLRPKLSTILLTVQLMVLSGGYSAALGQGTIVYRPKHTFFQRHPYLKAAGIGIFTGGLGGVLLGGGAAAGAAGGAAKGAGFHFLKDRWHNRSSAD